MDKGERAYIKAEELEGYLRRQAQTAEKRTSVCAAYYPRTAAEAGYAPCVVTGSGAVAIAVSLTLSAPQGVNGSKLWLYAGENRAAYTSVTLPAGGVTGVTLFACAYPEADGTTVRVCANEQGLIIDEMRVMAEGNGAAIEARRTGRVCDCAGNEIYTAWEDNGAVYVRRYGGDASVNAVHGNVFDLCATEDGIALFCCDDDDNLWGITYAPDLTERARAYLGAGFDRVAIGRNVFGFTLAAIRNRKVYFAQCESDFSGMSDWAAADFATEADEVYFCKQSLCPVLFLRRDGRLYAKIPVWETGDRDCVRCTVTLETA